MAQENSSSQGSAGRKKKKRKKRRFSFFRFIFGLIGRLILTIFTLGLIGVLSLGIFFNIFMTYVNTTLVPTLDVSVEDLTLRLSSTLYDANGQEMRTIYSEENREIVPLDQIPEHMINALIAIEDKRFRTHQGVDWEGTAAAFYKTFVTGSTRGGSTLTQQVLRLVTQDDDVTVKRKVREIFRALEFEKNYTKDDVLYLYLNLVYFGQSCYGVQSASQVYFGKDVSELSLAESACIIGITNNPSLYDPFYDIEFEQKDGSVKTPRQFNKSRQELILDQMLDQGMITEAECKAAKAEKLLFTDTPEYAALQAEKEAAEAAAAEAAAAEGTTEDGDSQEEDLETAEEDEEGGGRRAYSWFEDAAISDAIQLVMEAQGCSKDVATQLIYSGGYKIYTTLQPDIQAIVDEIYEDPSNFDYPSAKGTPLDSAMTVVDPYTGDVVAMAGGVGVKEADRILNLATSRRPVGSAIKPLSVYAPAIENDLIGPGSIVDDYPYTLNSDSTGGYPKNSGNKYRGKLTVNTAVQWSYNTTAAHILRKLGTATAFEFMENNLGFDLVSADNDIGPLAMGGLTYGVSTVDMAAAFGAFSNAGVYTAPRLITRIEDNDGNIVVENPSHSQVAMKETTVYLMNKMLTNVVTSGTGTSASFKNMTIGGKTGTTSNNFDRYFVGYTPYYSTAVWVGYAHSNEKINAGSTNPAAIVWRLVMEKLHEGLENKSFIEKPSGIVKVDICADCGMLPGPLCELDQRGSRIVSAEMTEAAAPTEICTCHVELPVCSLSGMDPCEFCPADQIITKVFCNNRTHMEIPPEEPIIYDDGTVEPGTLIVADDSAYFADILKRNGVCTSHTAESFIPEEPLPGDPGYEYPDYPDWWPDWWPAPDPEDPGDGTAPEEPDVPGDTDPTPEEPDEPALPDEPSLPDIP